MIPRPHEEFNHQEAEFSRHDQQLERLQSLIRSYAAPGGANTRKFPGTIDMHNLDDQNPLSSGYEIIADFDNLELPSDDSEKKKISVVPVLDDKCAAGAGSKGPLLLGMDDASTDGDVDEDDDEEEEGLEVVGLGRFGTFSEEYQEGTLDDFVHSFSRSRSSKTMITYYCPEDEPITETTATALD